MQLQSSSSLPEVTISSLETHLFLFCGVPPNNWDVTMPNRASFISILTFFAHQSIYCDLFAEPSPLDMAQKQCLVWLACCTKKVASNVTNYSNHMKGACNQTRKQRQFNSPHTTRHAYKIVQTIVYFQSSCFFSYRSQQHFGLWFLRCCRYCCWFRPFVQALIMTSNEYAHGLRCHVLMCGGSIIQDK